MRSTRPTRRTKGRRLVSAGQVLGIAVVCFATWLVLDAHQLYSSAIAAPLGARRSIAVTILRPLARASGALGLGQPLRGVDRALGRDGTPGGSVASVPAPHLSRSDRVGTATVRGRALTIPASSSSSSSSTMPSEPLLASSPPLGPPRIAEPSPAHRLTILDIGDSIGEDLGYGLGDALGGNPSVRIVQDAVGSTGLAALGYYDWPAELEVELRRYRPGIVVVMLGGNDAQSFDVGSRFVGFATPLWQSVYGARVATIMREATAAGAHVLWVGMPMMSPTATLSSADMQAENAVYAAEARAHPGVLYLPSWSLLADAAGRYSEYLPDASGSLVQVRDSDGIHVDAPGGTDLLAGAAVAEMERAWHLRLQR
ncbi:MAG: hypothetical protein JWO62_3545 [Acidimicrobiaceae bacterium]|nr:hypothetical protein [Acidimicrobiaceae bacterium]